MAATIHFGFRANCVGLTRDISNPLAYLHSSSGQFNCKPFVKLTTEIREIKYKKCQALQIRCESAERLCTYEENSITDEKQLSIVMKFGGSSVATAARMKEVVDLILCFPEESPVIVLSAMGKTTNNLLLSWLPSKSCISGQLRSLCWKVLLFLASMAYQLNEEKDFPIELVSSPLVIFMDEPTSGLDARAAAIVIRAVRKTVDTGRTVVCTIHQPSIEIFEAFDEDTIY